MFKIVIICALVRHIYVNAAEHDDCTVAKAGNSGAGAPCDGGTVCYWEVGNTDPTGAGAGASAKCAAKGETPENYVYFEGGKWKCFPTLKEKKHNSYKANGFTGSDPCKFGFCTAQCKTSTAKSCLVVKNGENYAVTCDNNAPAITPKCYVKMKIGSKLTYTTANPPSGCQFSTPGKYCGKECEDTAKSCKIMKQDKKLIAVCSKDKVEKSKCHIALNPDGIITETISPPKGCTPDTAPRPGKYCGKECEDTAKSCEIMKEDKKLIAVCSKDEVEKSKCHIALKTDGLMTETISPPEDCTPDTAPPPGKYCGKECEDTAKSCEIMKEDKKLIAKCSKDDVTKSKCHIALKTYGIMTEISLPKDCTPEIASQSSSSSLSFSVAALSMIFSIHLFTQLRQD